MYCIFLVSPLAYYDEAEICRRKLLSLTQEFFFNVKKKGKRERLSQMMQASSD